MTSLIQQLLALGFIPAINTSEAGFHGRLTSVREGIPNRFGRNNGVVAVYDEQGRPWVALASTIDEEELERFLAEYNFPNGVYVPHSNDGGAFIRGRMPSVGVS